MPYDPNDPSRHIPDWNDWAGNRARLYKQDDNLRRKEQIAKAREGRRIVFPKGGTVSLKLRFDFFDVIGGLMRGIQELHQRPEKISKLLKRVMAEVWLARVREDFLQRLPFALDMQMMSKTRRPRALNTEEMARMQDLYEGLRSAQIEGDLGQARDARRRIVEYRSKVISAYNREKYSGKQITPSGLSTGSLMRRRSLQIMQLMTDAGQIRMEQTANGLMVGIGSQRKVLNVRTPSATEFALKKGRSNSRYQHLWRHLEYGTGVYSKDPEGGDNKRATRYNHMSLPPWHWAYSKNPPKGLVLRGSRGMHVLRDEKGAERQDEAEALMTRFANYFTVLLVANTMGPGKLRR